MSGGTSTLYLYFLDFFLVMIIAIVRPAHDLPRKIPPCRDAALAPDVGGLVAHAIALGYRRNVFLRRLTTMAGKTRNLAIFQAGIALEGAGLDVVKLISKFSH